MHSLALRPRTEADEDFLFRLYAEMREPEFAQLPLSNEQKQGLIRMQYVAQNASYAAMYAASDYQVIVVDGEPAGKVWIAKDSASFSLADIALTAQMQNHGIGTELIKRFQQEATLAGLPIRASVFRFNFGSLRFHQRLGFEIMGEDEVQYRMEWRPAASR